MTIIELSEEYSQQLASDQFEIEAARILRDDPKKRISVILPNALDNYYYLKSNGWVGFFPLTDRYTLHITPKVKTKNIFRMLEYAYKLESFEFLLGEVKVDSVEDVFENLASILAKLVIERSRKGLYLDYVNMEENLQKLKGKINFLPSFLSISRGNTSIRCTYCEHTPDLIENQILLWTLYRLRKHQFVRADVSHLLNLAYRELVNKVDIRDVKPSECINRLYNRLNQNYEPMHLLCRFFLEHSGPGSEVGKEDFLPFMLDMPNLFQQFVAEWLEQNLPSHYSIEKQYNAKLDDNDNFYFLIDLVLIDTSRQTVVAVLDTKYKKDKIDQGDIQQVIAYAARMRTEKAFLIYPEVPPKEINEKAGDIKIQNLFFDIREDIEISGKAFLKDLENKLNE